MNHPTDAEFQATFETACRLTATVQGHLTTREIRCLAVLAAVPSTEGEILEIGTFKGRSTIVLAKSAALAGPARIVAVDPLTSPAPTDPSLGGEKSAWPDLQRNLKQAGVESSVEFHMERSEDLARKWTPARKLRLLWIDGDHTYGGAKTDFDLFRPFLANGAIVAMHDVLHSHGGPARVFAEDILLSPHFGPFGFSGSIGWSQYFEQTERSLSYRAAKLKTYGPLSRVVGATAFGQRLQGMDYLRFKLARSRIPHGDLDFTEFRRMIT